MALTEAQKKAQAKWRANNKDKINANIKRYRDRHPEINAESNRSSKHTLSLIHISEPTRPY